MTRQEENWKLMTLLQIPWSECVKVTEEDDREFLLGKADEVKDYVEAQQQKQVQEQQKQLEDAQSSIISPMDLGIKQYRGVNPLVTYLSYKEVIEALNEVYSDYASKANDYDTKKAAMMARWVIGDVKKKVDQKIIEKYKDG